MKKFFISLAVFVMALCANAQTDQYFWYNGNLMMGNPIAQIDSVTFGEGEPADTLHILLPRTIIKEVHDTVYITVHDTVCPNVNMYLGHEYVDLGLPSGLLWATCNIGADSPELSGGYYSWGEVNTKSSYLSSDYLYKDNQISLNDISGTQYDAARANWSGEWRMPTKDEIAELASNCSFVDTTINSINGILLRSNFNNNTIFIPKAGIMDDATGEAQGIETEIWPHGIGLWTSTACGSSTAYRAWEWSYVSYSWRRQGMPIRPVLNSSAINQ